MIGSIRHLRATTAEWKEANPVIPDGELALERTPAGSTVIKIGNGVDVYSDLPSIFGRAVKQEDSNVFLKNGERYSCGSVHSLSLILPDEPDDDFYCEVSFISRNNVVDFAFENGRVLLSGDSTADSILIPDPYTYYTVFIWYEGSIFHGVVRGVPYVS